MSSMDYDPQTGLPRNRTNTGVNAAPQFNTGAAGATGATGVGGTFGVNGAAGGPNFGAYTDILQRDPFYKQTLADLTAQGFADDASAKAAAQSGFIRFGEVPANLDPALSGWIDPTTQTLAQQNTAAGLSTLAQLQKALRDRTRSEKNDLARRGLLRSGELGHRMNEVNQEHAQAQYTARLQLTDYLGGLQRGMAEAARQRAAAQAAAAQAAASRGIASGVGVAPAPAPAPTTATAPYTAPIEPPAPARPPVYSTAYGTPGFNKPLLDPLGGGF